MKDTMSVEQFEALCESRGLFASLINYGYWTKSVGAVESFLDLKASQSDDVPVLKGDFFIVPNAIADADENFFRFTHRKMLELEVTPDEPMVRIWVTSPESDNWSDHGIDYSPRYNGRFVSHLPLRILKDVKEGDTLTLTRCDGKQTFELTAKQLGYRYCKGGAFEEALKVLREV